VRWLQNRSGFMAALWEGSQDMEKQTPLAAAEIRLLQG